MKITKRLMFLLAAALLIVSCAPAAVAEEAPAVEAVEEIAATEEPTAEPEPMVFIDDMENKLAFTAYPNAIVSLSPSITELLFFVEAGEQVVGRDEMSLYPADALEVESVGAMWGELPAEAILAAEPDVVIVAEIISPETVAALQDLGVQVYWQANPLTFEDLYQNIRDLAALTGNEDNVESLIADLEARVLAVEEKIGNAQNTPSVFYELDATDPANPWTAGGNTFVDTVIRMAGGANVAAALEGDYAQFSSEALIEADPEVIVLADAPFGITPESVADRAGWGNISAVQNGSVYPFDPEILSIPGPRLVAGLEAMAKLLHPELFE